VFDNGNQYQYQKTVYKRQEFHGDFWHGNPRVFDKDKIHPIKGVTFGEIYEASCAKDQKS